jgi:2-hydroxychromene-2-carboxylate isomerase
MHLIVYGDFNCPYSYLASQRVDELARLGEAEVEWRAVEHDPVLALTGTPSSLDPERWRRELAELALVAAEDEQAPGVAPSLISNTGAAVAAYAEAVTDGVQDDLRRSLFSEIWANRRHLSGPYGVRQLVCALMYPAGTRSEQLATPDLPARIHHRAGPGALPRLSGCTISPGGVPLTADGHDRIRRWRDEWLSGAHGMVPAVGLPDGMVPAVGLPDGMVTGVAALARLAELAGHTAALPRQPAGVGR